MFLTYTRRIPVPLPEFTPAAPPRPPFAGQSVGVFLNRLTAERIRRDKRANRRSEPGLVVALAPGAPPPIPPVPKSIIQRVQPFDVMKWKRRFRQADLISVTGPGLTARPPFAGVAVRPRFTPRDLMQRRRRFRPTDVLAALSGLTARSQGSFVGAKTAFLTVTPTRAVSGLTIMPTRSGSFTLDPGS